MLLSHAAEEYLGFAIRKLKRRKVPGPDNLMAEHLIEGGDVVTVLELVPCR